MDVHQVELTISAVQASQYPTGDQPEIALVGRSNVGKSSLTNVLINRKNFAHTSSQPGKTQTLNFYHVEEALYFVDVPGYGYAKVSKKQREQFGKMIEAYLSTRNQLKGVIELVDGRHALYLRLGEEMPFTPLCFKNWSILSQWGQTAGATPTQQNIFYHFAAWSAAQ